MKDEMALPRMPGDLGIMTAPYGWVRSFTEETEYYGTHGVA